MRLSPTTSQTKAQSSLFNGIWLNWEALSQSERVYATGIVLIPLWWLWGWSYLLFLLALGVLAYEYHHQGKIELNRPHPLVLFLFTHSAYGIIAKIVYGSFHPGAAFSTKDFTGTFNDIIAPAILIWYIQTKRIRVRPQVVGWAFSVVVVLMLLFWVVIFFGWKEAEYNPSRSIFGFLTGKSSTFVIGAGNTNYLRPYRTEDSSIAGFARYFFFFHGPESLAVVLGFVNLLALDLKNRVWSFLLLTAGVFLLLLSGTRSAWLALTFVMVIRFLLTTGKVWGFRFICGLIAIVAFFTLCLPPVTNLILDTANNSAKATSDYRGDSTEVRGEIYRRTIQEIQNSSNIQFLFGFVEEGEGVLPGYEPAKVGTHSLYLGTLLYRRGVIGAAIFAGYWLSLIHWLYQTRVGRPLSRLLFFLILTLSFCVMAFESTIMPITLIAVGMGEHQPNQLKQRKNLSAVI
ncbi:O-antigen ligase family protein [Anabaena sp. UHCC 0451]|uniref:O-antigen ligase family protein n=1 Tax=Anabaena sp. UHCC 0451 TaxID=2055235 RepID=UPI002B1FCAC4|nr:O-antigen ligase family protein [Anabaena sp. UHCC 0451]MEA5579253.1 O-antigen ligase family protein [Anabaena sp. UHCC 0451]